MKLPATGGRALDALLQYEPDNYGAPDYIPTRQVTEMHDWPRWGWTKQFTSVFEEQDQRSEYIKGVAIGSIITLFVFIVWALVLLCLKCAGKRVGCASGVPRKPEEPKLAGSISEETYQRNLRKWTTAVTKHERQLLISRIIFLSSGVGVIVSSILFFVMGVGSLVNSLNDIQGSIGDTRNILVELHNITGTFIEVGEETAADRDAFADETNGLCVVVDAAVDNALGEEVQQEIDDVVETLQGVDDFLRDTAESLQGDLAEAIQYAEDAHDTVNYAYPFLYCTAAVMGILIIIAICLMIEVALAWRGRKMKNCFVSCMKNAVILPIFFLFVILSWLFASLFQVAAIGSADFCYQPEITVDYLLEKYVAERMSPVLFAYLTYYLRCSVDRLPTQINSEADLFWTAVNTVHDFLEYAENNGDSIINVCGDGSLNLIQTLASALHSTLHVANDLLIAVLNLLKCSTFNPIYVGVLHNGLCVNGASGLAWLFSTLLCMGIFSMIMITLRAGRMESEGGARYVEDIDGGYEPYNPARKSFANEEDHDLALEQDAPVIEPDT